MAIEDALKSKMLRRLLPPPWRWRPPVVPVVRLSGPIGGVPPFASGLTLAGVARQLERAFETKGAVAVALVINSPGGSAVQSHLIFTRIRSLASEHDMPVVAFVEDAAASGGYMIACAADEIVADPSSIVGSIGVVSAGFGFVDAIAKLGIERRMHTAGENKAILDAFLPEKAEDVARLKALQAEVHRVFVTIVEARRGAVLDREAPGAADLFTGAFWTGLEGHALGLVDNLGEIRSVLRERYGADVDIRPIPAERTLFGRRVPSVAVADALDPSRLGPELVATLKARALWARYGL